MFKWPAEQLHWVKGQMESVTIRLFLIYISVQVPLSQQT